MASFDLHSTNSTTGQTYWRYGYANSAFWQTAFAVSEAPAANRGPGGTNNKIVLTNISMMLDGYSSNATCRYVVWNSSGNSALVYSGNFTATANGSSTTSTTQSSVGITLAVNGGGSYRFGVHNQGGDLIIRRRPNAGSGRNVKLDTSYTSGGVDENDNRDGYTFIGSVSYITVASKPQFVIGSGGKKQISFSWTAPSSTGDSAITKYLVEYKKSTDSTYTVIDTGSTALSRTITGLDNNTTYNVRVAAWNGASTTLGFSSEYSDVVNFTTLPGGPQIRSDVTTWSPSEIYVSTSAGSWPSTANAEMYVCTGVSPTVWTPIA